MAIDRVGVLLIHDLGRPERFLHMLRVFKPTSALSVGTYILSRSARRPGRRPRSSCSAGSAAEALRRIVSALFAGRWRPTRRCCSPTPRPSWRAPHKQLPFVFAGSAMAPVAVSRWCSRRWPRRGRRGRWRHGGGHRAGCCPQGRERPRHRQRAVPRGPRGTFMRRPGMHCCGRRADRRGRRTRLGAVASGTLLAAGPC